MLRQLTLCCSSALLLVFAFPWFNLEWCAWFAFVPFLFAVADAPRPKAFLLGCLTGFLFWWGVVYWLMHVTLAGTTLLTLYLALYFGVFAFVFSRFSNCRAPYTAAAVWVVLEYVRAHLFTGFPWALLGYSQYLNLPAIQVADLAGAWGVSFAIMAVNAGIYQSLTQRSNTASALKHIVPALVCVAFVFGYGFYAPRYRLAAARRPPLKVSVIQGNIPQELKWQPHATSFILTRYMGLTRSAVNDSPDLVVWPEAASPGIWGEDEFVKDNVFSLAKGIGIPLLIGAVVREGQGYYNSALLVGREGRVLARYDKLHLVPFGEYIPLRKVFPFLETVVPIGEIGKGSEYVLFDIASFKPQERRRFGVLICFEDLFPELSRAFRLKGAEFLVNITNDAWYQKTAAAEQHFQASVLRAVENRLSLLRAANTGVSGFIAPDGSVRSRVRDERGNTIFVDGWSTEAVVSAPAGQSLYTRYGDWFIIVCFLFFIYGIIRAL